MLRAILLLSVLTLMVGCSKPPAEKNYALKGEIVSLDAQTKTATIKHEKIGDWMDAMTMEFPVRDPKEFAKLQPGQKITATVHTVPDTFQYWITDIRTQTP